MEMELAHIFRTTTFQMCFEFVKHPLGILQFVKISKLNIDRLRQNIKNAALYFRKSLAEHEELVAAMDGEDQELEKAIATSNDDKIRLQAQQKDQNDILTEHLMNKVDISDPSIRK